MRIVLIGYMGTGKSTSGRLLAKELQYDFVDLDEYISQKHNKSISQIFTNEGEASFRNLETTYLIELLEKENIVIAAGGGTPCFNNNIELINRHALSIYIQADTTLLSKRLFHSNTERPLIKGKNEQELLEFIHEGIIKREPFYKQAKHTLFSKRQTPDMLTKQLIKIIKP